MAEKLLHIRHGFLQVSRNYAAAQEASNQAKKWSIVGICCGLAWVIIYIILMVCGVLANL